MKFLTGGPVFSREDVSGRHEAAVVDPGFCDDIALPEIQEVGWWESGLSAEGDAGFAGAVVLDQLLDRHGTHACAELAFNEVCSGVCHGSSDVAGGSSSSSRIDSGGFAADCRARVGELLGFGDGDSALKRNVDGIGDDGSSDEQLFELDPEKLLREQCWNVGAEAE